MMMTTMKKPGAIFTHRSRQLYLLFFFCFIVHLKEDRSYRGNASDCSKYEDEEESENNVDKESKNNEDDNRIKELFLRNGSSFVFPKIFFF